MNKTFKDEVLKAISKTKEDKIALVPIANRLQDEFMGILPENVVVDTEEEVNLYASYEKIGGKFKHCVLVLSVKDDIDDKEMAVALTDKQALDFARKLLNKYDQVNELNGKLRDLGVSE